MRLYWAHSEQAGGVRQGQGRGEVGVAPCQGGGNGVFMSYTESIHEKLNIEIINIERSDEGRSLVVSTF